MPVSAISDASSGGDCSRTRLTAVTMPANGSCSDSKISSLLSVKLRGTPSARLRPRTSISRTSSAKKAVPTSIFTRSAVLSPITLPYLRRTKLTIASSKRSPPMRTESENTTPFSDSMAISVVPPPMSTTIEPIASSTGRPAPMAAAMGSSIKKTSRAPALKADSLIARFSTSVAIQGTQINTLGLGGIKLLVIAAECTFLIKCCSIFSVTWKSAITPSLRGRIAVILPGVRPNIRLASIPTASTIFWPK